MRSPNVSVSATRKSTLYAYFALGRGTPEQLALEMTKWFDTNYHFLVSGIYFAHRISAAASDPLCREVSEAKELGISAKVVLVGPITYLRL